MVSKYSEKYGMGEKKLRKNMMSLICNFQSFSERTIFFLKY